MIAASALLVAGITLLCTSGHHLLPIIFENGNYALVVKKGLSPAMLVFCLLAIGALARRSSRSVLDVWMIVVMVLWILEVLMSAVIGTSRYDLGWYVGRIFGLCAGTFILVVLLWEANSLYQSLSAALAAAAQSERDLLRSREELSACPAA